MAEPRRVFHIYVDETSKNATYFGVGAIFCSRDSAQQIASSMTKMVVKHGHDPEKEIHWTELKKHLLPLYKEVGATLVSYTHKRRGSAAMRFRALIVESSKIDRSIDKTANREDIIAKFVFTLVYGFAEKFGRNIDYHVFIDSPDGSEGLNVPTQCSLNNKCKSQLGYENQPFKSVRYVRSEKSRLIQATDLLAGVVAYECNGQHLAPSASAHRKDLWSTMLAASKLKTFAAPTSYWPDTFQLQHFDFERSRATRFRAAH